MSAALDFEQKVNGSGLNLDVIVLMFFDKVVSILSCEFEGIGRSVEPSLIN